MPNRSARKSSIQRERRIRRRDGIDRGEELAAALRLAEQFPSKVSRYLTYPNLKDLIKRSATDADT